ncbi:hypothetical protein DYB36_009278 [Aphanomyces astaci]|uniref:Peptidase C1A papain C-terminal domain-containing protein n=1 Tax=Aphanomyces astaci TaxID=112090 RepID=A0A397BNB8_APHAT|nr:hypothetical protein DYB36_009278 [Aphanomyces astaci]
MRAAFALSALAATATAAKQSVVSLTADERLTLEQALAEWKAEFGAVARENNLLPTKNSILSEDEQVVAELQRILDSKFSAEQAARGSHLRGEIIDTLEDETASLQATSKDWTTSGLCECRGKPRQLRIVLGCSRLWGWGAESAHCIKTGTLLKLSEQQVTSCSTNGGSQGCNGGWPWYCTPSTTLPVGCACRTRPAELAL